MASGRQHDGIDRRRPHGAMMLSGPVEWLPTTFGVPLAVGRALTLRAICAGLPAGPPATSKHVVAAARSAASDVHASREVGCRTG